MLSEGAPLGYGGGLFGGYIGDRDYSRSATPPPPGPSGNPVASLTHEQLTQCAECLLLGIQTNFEVKRRDLQGRTYLNCFMGKEAINWSDTRTWRSERKSKRHVKRERERYESLTASHVSVRSLFSALSVLLLFAASLRSKLPKSLNSTSDVVSILQQMLQENFLLPGQSVEVR